MKQTKRFPELNLYSVLLFITIVCLLTFAIKLSTHYKAIRENKNKIEGTRLNIHPSIVPNLYIELPLGLSTESLKKIASIDFPFKTRFIYPTRCSITEDKCLKTEIDFNTIEQTLNQLKSTNSKILFNTQKLETSEIFKLLFYKNKNEKNIDFISSNNFISPTHNYTQLYLSDQRPVITDNKLLIEKANFTVISPLLGKSLNDFFKGTTYNDGENSPFYISKVFSSTEAFKFAIPISKMTNNLESILVFLTHTSTSIIIHADFISKISPQIKKMLFSYVVSEIDPKDISLQTVISATNKKNFMTNTYSGIQISNKKSKMVFALEDIVLSNSTLIQKKGTYKLKQINYEK